MKKLSVTVGIIAVIIACNSASDTKETAAEQKTEPTTTPAPSTSLETQYQKGLELVAGSDCTTCHKINEKNIGPAYADVAKKYEPTPANIDTLASRIIRGSQGFWGTVPMTAHAAISMDDAREMVKYILSLKNQ